MSEFGSYDSGVEKFKKMNLGKDEEEDSEINHDDRDQLIEDASQTLDGVIRNMSPELQETMQTILDTTQDNFDNKPELATETLEELIPILQQFDGLVDPTEIEEKESELADEIDTLAKMAKRLGEAKKVH